MLKQKKNNRADLLPHPEGRGFHKVEQNHYFKNIDKGKKSHFIGGLNL